jgi:hypothetical protein
MGDKVPGKKTLTWKRVHNALVVSEEMAKGKPRYVVEYCGPDTRWRLTDNTRSTRYVFKNVRSARECKSLAVTLHNKEEGHDEDALVAVCRCNRKARWSFMLLSFTDAPGECVYSCEGCTNDVALDMMEDMGSKTLVMARLREVA